MRSNLNIAAIFNFVVAGLFFISLGFAFDFYAIGVILFLVFSGVYYIKSMNLEIEKLEERRNMLLALGLLSIPFNIVSAIMILISCKLITNEYYMFLKSKDAAVARPKRPQDGFIIGTVVVALAGFILYIGEYASISNVLKVMMLFIFAFLFVVFFLLSTKLFKMKDVSNVYLFFSFLFFILSFIVIGKNGMFCTWLSFDGVGSNLYYSFIYFLSFIAFLSLYRRTRFTLFNCLMYIFLVFSLVCGLSYIKFTINIEINYIFSLLAVIFLLISIFARNRKLKFAFYISSLVFAMLLFISNLFYSSSLLIVVDILCLATLLITCIVNKYKVLKIITFIFMELVILVSLMSFRLFEINVLINATILLVVNLFIVILSIKNKVYLMISNLFLIVASINLISFINISSVTTIFVILFLFYILLLINRLFVKDVKIRNVFYIIFSTLLLIPTIFYSDIVVAIFGFVVSIIILIIGFVNSNYKGLRFVGGILSLVILIYRISELIKSIPIWVYILFIGLVLIGIFIVIAIKQNKKAAN